jgi:hypothetical protein
MTGTEFIRTMADIHRDEAAGWKAFYESDGCSAADAVGPILAVCIHQVAASMLAAWSVEEERWESKSGSSATDSGSSA